MTHGLSQLDLKACRAFDRLFLIHTEGWHEAEAADAHWDAGEWSGPAWGDNWAEADYHCQQVIADRFGVTPAYVMLICNQREAEEQYRCWLAAHVKYVIYGAIDDSDVQEIASVTSWATARRKVEKLNNQPNNHPDLHYWAVKEDERPLNPIPHGDTVGDLI